MATFDIIIKDGMIFDGARNPRYQADLGIKDGIITEIGFLRASDAERVIDGNGSARRAGLHRSAHALRRADLLGPVLLDLRLARHHIGGHRQLRVRPRAGPARTARPFDACADPQRSDSAGVDAAGNPVGLGHLPRVPRERRADAEVRQLLPYVGLTPLMIWVMGMERAKAGEMPTEQEHAEMRRLLHEAMDAGACGWSVQRMSAEINFQRDYDGTPMATDVMHDETAYQLAEVLAERNDGFIQMTLARSIVDPTGDRLHTERLAEISRRPIIWNALSASVAGPIHRSNIEWLRSCIERGLRVYAQASTTEVPMFFTFEDWNLWDDSPAWREATIGSPEEKLAKLADPVVREGMRATPTLAGSSGPIEDVVLLRTGTPEHKQFENLKISDICRVTGKDPIDAILDIAVADGLKALFYCEPFAGPRVIPPRGCRVRVRHRRGLRRWGAHEVPHRRPLSHRVPDQVGA